jgi:hypothetical protein
MHGFIPVFQPASRRAFYFRLIICIILMLGTVSSVLASAQLAEVSAGVSLPSFRPNTRATVAPRYLLLLPRLSRIAPPLMILLDFAMAERHLLILFILGFSPG